MARANSSPTLEVFQNISCYCLTQFHVGRRDSDTISKHLMLLFNVFFPLKEVNIPTFQNISCYCLTIMQLFIFSKIIIFQNISCYCLTHLRSPHLWPHSQISKHLMLLFNLIFSRKKHHATTISKHLMLLFNFYVDADYLKETKFQNISCYCLTLNTGR